jgi:hypothetical protein
MSTEAHDCDFQLPPLYPFRPPDWRWQAARGDVEEGRDFGAEDPTLNTLIEFQHELKRARTATAKRRVAHDWPDLSAAHRLRSADAPRWEVEARILAGQDDATIAARCCLSPEAVRFYHDAFYDVRPKLRARDWITIRAIDPEGQGGLPAVLRKLAYHGGPFVVEVVLAVTRGEPLPDWAVSAASDDRAYAEARLRKHTNLLIAAMLAKTPAELLDVIDDYDKAAFEDRARSGDAAVFRGDTRIPRLMLELAAGCFRRPRRRAARKPKPTVEPAVETPPPPAEVTVDV